MRTVLTLLLLAGPVAAQTIPTPTGTTTPAATALQVTAQPGTLVEYAVRSTSHLDVNDVVVTALPGSQVSQDELTFMQAFMGGLFKEVLSSKTAEANLSKQFVKVLPALPDGRPVLLDSAVHSDGKKTLQTRVTRAIGPDGTLTVLDVTSTDADLQAAIKANRTQALQAFLPMGGSVYGRPLTPGTTWTVTQDLDAGVALSSAFGDRTMQGTLRAVTTRTFTGLNERGEAAFQVTSVVQPGVLRLRNQAGDLSITVESMVSEGQETYRADGLPSTSSSRTRGALRMTLAMDDEGVQVAMRATIDSAQTSTAR
ncbi:hypothetical protein [Deinococcus maricopensis]|uniref:Uncharacterized protein n=1 Tax=Deinococcus maricopensis (strain DSM 21211 / LMG 22137 / NRRL B-23946 / LB-34) TaxID=709986 RepID=E8U547_DEIML|nr:hypothetical protein [Deinococcus maricopensis]ADV66186.1 hypothetical protein Deima_0527 [Deinococcus maricopensis DSM 21211]